MIIIFISVTPLFAAVFRLSIVFNCQLPIANCQCECESNANCNVYAGCLWPNAVAGRKKMKTRFRPMRWHTSPAFPRFPTFRSPLHHSHWHTPSPPFDLSRLSFKRTSKCWLSAFNPNVNVWRLNWPEKRVLWPPSQTQSSSSLKHYQNHEHFKICDQISNIN